jgi:hypothetical protein
VLGFTEMPAARTATRMKAAVGIEWVVEGRHQPSCATLPPN